MSGESSADPLPNDPQIENPIPTDPENQDSKVSEPKPPHLHLAFTTVPNIKIAIPITLNLKDDNFPMWKLYFEMLFERLDLLGYVTGSVLPSSASDKEWYQLDAHIRSWIFSTISVDIARLLIKQSKPTSLLWSAIDSLFSDNQASRVMELQTKFANTIKANLSMTEYCQIMKTLHDRLLDLEVKTDEKALVLQIIHGLPSDYNSVHTIVPLLKPFPSFTEVRSMLLLEEARIAHASTLDSNSSSPHALYSQHQNSNSNKNKNWNNNWNKNKNNKNKNSNWNNNNRGLNFTPPPSPGWSPRPPVAAQPPPPPPAWTGQSHQSLPLPSGSGSCYQQPQQHLGLLGPGPQQQQQAYTAVTPPWTASPSSHHYWSSSSPVHALANQFNGVSIRPPTDNWYMDSGASNHFASNPGSQDKQGDSPVQ